MDQLLTKLMQLDFSFLLYISVELVVLALIYRWARKLHSRWKGLINLALVILVIRIILFQNPLAWYVYNHTLDPEVIGWRQSSILYDKFNQFKEHENVEYLAVGSSQTGAIYNFSRDTLSNFRVKSLAGLGALDLYLYRHNILNYDPENILLYLSDFDMGRAPTLETVKLAPRQGFQFYAVYSTLQNHFSGEQFTRVMKEMLVGELFPEYKYSFIFKGYIDQLFNRNSAFPTVAASMSEAEYRAYQFKQLEKVIQVDHIDLNLFYLNKFISFFEERDISILIIEGQYNPKAYTPKNLIVKRRVRHAFKALEKEYLNVAFIPKSETMTFDASDYRDAYHVTQAAGVKFTKSMLKQLHALEPGPLVKN